MRAALIIAAVFAASAAHGAEPKPVVNPADSYGQHLLSQALAENPGVIIMMMHVTPPGSKDNVVVASNIGRYGKKADEDDMEVIQKGEANKEVAENGKRFEAELPLNDAHGKRVGALAYKAGDDKQALVAHAVKIRDEMAAHIASPAVLLRKAS